MLLPVTFFSGQNSIDISRCPPPFFLGGGVLNLIRHGVGLIWTKDQLVAKASTDTGQHKRQTFMPPGGF
jgi:hypothetical protein